MLWSWLSAALLLLGMFLPSLAHAQLFDGPDIERSTVTKPKARRSAPRRQQGPVEQSSLILRSADGRQLTEIESRSGEESVMVDPQGEIGEEYFQDDASMPGESPGSVIDNYMSLDAGERHLLLNDPAHLPSCPRCDGERECESCNQNAKPGTGLLDWQLWCRLKPHLPKIPTIQETGLRNRMVGTSWLNRPYHADWFFGAYFGDKLTRNVKQDTVIISGYRFGKDETEYWGWETRFSYAGPTLSGPDGMQLQKSADAIFWDATLVYYPWGDTVGRPYLTTGLGLAHFDFYDENRQSINANVLGIPIGMGMKWRYNNWTLLRIEFLDNISVGGSGVRSMHNVSFTAGFEFRFGGSRHGYWPWNPGSYIR